MSLRVLVWSPNYAPELTGIPPLVTDACRWLLAQGHEVEVVTAFPNYPQRRIPPQYRGSLWRTETLDGVTVHRSWLRVRPRESFVDKAMYEATFAAFSLPHVLRQARRVDVLVCVVPSLLAAATARALGRTVPRIVLWWQDLVLSAAHALDGIGPLTRCLLKRARTVEAIALRGADRVISCSPGFADYLIQQGGQRDRITTVLNWVDTQWIVPTEPDPAPITRVLYSGNLGYTQGFETVIEAMRLLPADVELDIVGNGNAASHIRRLAQVTQRIRVAPPVPDRAYPALLGRAHIHLVLQRKVGAGVNLPSKIGPYLASGRPVVASIDPRTAAADLLRESGGAIIVQPEDPRALAEALKQLHDDRQLGAAMAARGRTFAERVLGRDVALPRLERAIVGD